MNALETREFASIAEATAYYSKQGYVTCSTGDNGKYMRKNASAPFGFYEVEIQRPGMLDVIASVYYREAKWPFPTRLLPTRPGQPVFNPENIEDAML